MQYVEIRVKGRVDEHWSEWFGGLSLTYPDQDVTLLSGKVADQAALYGVLARLRDLALPLLSVRGGEVDRREGT